jgi:mannose-6-phosphate isomerase
MPETPRQRQFYRCQPALFERPWGGNALSLWGKFPQSATVGESWELGDLPDFSTPLGDGLTLGCLCRDATDPLGLGGVTFPLLVKLLDARENLSVQLHPFQATVDGLPKTEAWLVLEAPDDAAVLLGVTRELPAKELIEAVAQGNMDLLDRIPVQAGDVVLVPGGTLHALTKGLLVAEVQQSSDTTWRVWDWNRKDAAGNGRTLHIEQAIRDVNPKIRAGLKVAPLSVGDGRELLCACPSFAMARNWGASRAVHAASGFKILMQLQEGGTLVAGGSEETFAKGETILLPVGGEVELRGGVALEAWVPDLERDIVATALAHGHSREAAKALGAGVW